jgi:hypothetical protein
MKDIKRLLAEELSDYNTHCLAALSGGKDSVYQLHLLNKELGLSTVAFTWDHFHHHPAAINLARQTVMQLGNVEWVSFAFQQRWIRMVLYSFLKCMKNNCMCPQFMMLRALPYALEHRIPMIAIGYSPDQNYKKGEYKIPQKEERFGVMLEWVNSFKALIKLTVGLNFPNEVDACVDYLFTPVQKAIDSTKQNKVYPFILQTSEFFPWDRNAIENAIADYGWKPSENGPKLHTNCFYQPMRGYIEFKRNRLFIQSEIDYHKKKGDYTAQELDEEKKMWNYNDQVPACLNSYLDFLGMSYDDFNATLNDSSNDSVKDAFTRFRKALLSFQGWDVTTIEKTQI